VNKKMSAGMKKEYAGRNGLGQALWEIVMACGISVCGGITTRDD
jgi:hypothetical protein